MQQLFDAGMRRVDSYIVLPSIAHRNHFATDTAHRYFLARPSHSMITIALQMLASLDIGIKALRAV